MAGNKKTAAKSGQQKRKSLLRKGDTVMVISGGNGTTRILKGKTGKILKFVGAERVIIEGLNMVTRHQRAKGPTQPGGKIFKEAPIHVSNVMYYVESLKAPVKLKSKLLENGRKVRGYMHPEKNSFEQIAAAK